MAAADDKKISGHSIVTADNPGAMASVGNLTTGRISNVMAVIKSNYSDSIYAGVIQRMIIAGRETPIGDADYANAAIGSIYVRDRISSLAQSGFDIYLKKATGSSGWYPLVTQEEANQYVVTQTALGDEAATPTAAQVLGGEFTITPTAARNFTLPTAADIWALMPNARVGSTFQFKILNLAAATHAVTVVASASMTNGGRAGDFTIAYATTARFEVRFTSATAAVLIRT